MLPAHMASPSATKSNSLASFTTKCPRFQCRRQPLTVRAHSRFPGEGSSSWSSYGVDANLGVLRDRIEAVQIKERLELTCSTVLRSASLQMITRPPPPPQLTSLTCGRADQGRNSNYGWNYGGDREQLVNKSRRRQRSQEGAFELVYQVCRLVALVSSSIGVTCLSGTCLLYLVSIFAHNFGH